MLLIQNSTSENVFQKQRQNKNFFFSEKQQLREFIANRSVEMLEVLQAEGMWHQIETLAPQKLNKSSRNAKRQLKLFFIALKDNFLEHRSPDVSSQGRMVDTLGLQALWPPLQMFSSAVAAWKQPWTHVHKQTWLCPSKTWFPKVWLTWQLWFADPCIVGLIKYVRGKIRQK